MHGARPVSRQFKERWLLEVFARSVWRLSTLISCLALDKQGTKNLYNTLWNWPWELTVAGNVNPYFRHYGLASYDYNILSQRTCADVISSIIVRQPALVGLVLRSLRNRWPCQRLPHVAWQSTDVIELMTRLYASDDRNSCQLFVWR